MINGDLLKKLDILDDEQKNEVEDFINFLIQKKNQSCPKKHPKAGFLEKDTFIIENGFDEIPDCFMDYIE